MIKIDRKIYMPYKFILKFIISGPCWNRMLVITLKNINPCEQL